LEDLHDRVVRDIGVLALPDRLVDLRVELVAERVDDLDALFPEDVEHLLLYHLNARQQMLEVTACGGVVDRAFEIIEDREQLLDDPLAGTRDQVTLVARHAPAVVLELGLEPLRRLEMSGSLRTGGLELTLEIVAAKVELRAEVVREFRIDRVVVVTTAHR
jgi:hypothetical protein